MSIDAYNSDKIKLQESILKIYTTLSKNKDDTTQFDAIKDETKRLFERQEVIFRMISTITVVVMIVTIHQISQ
jgi:uncharacterized membrane protein